eukprot:2457433-Pleurochrysis_carterae.AAC.3
MRFNSAARRAAKISPTIVISLRIFSTASYDVGSVMGCKGARQRTIAAMLGFTACGGVSRDS